MEKKYTKITAKEAYEEYRNLGPSRSLSKLHQYLSTCSQETPTIDALKDYSKRYNWVKRVKLFDQKCEKAREDAIIKAEGKEVFDAYKAHMKVASLASVAIQKLLVHLAEHPEEMEGGVDAQRLATVMVNCTKQAEVLAGGVSDRQAKEETMTIDNRREEAEKENLAIIAAWKAREAMNRGKELPN